MRDELKSVDVVRRTPPGVRELKLVLTLVASVNFSRTPPGVRELKQLFSFLLRSWIVSHPSRGA